LAQSAKKTFSHNPYPNIIWREDPKKPFHITPLFLRAVTC